MGIRITGSPNTKTNSYNSSNISMSISWHSCPHCPINICLTGSNNTFINNLPAHRLWDLVNEICGIGNTITSSNDVFINN